MTKTELLAKITEQLEAGRTVTFSTYLRGVKVTARNYRKWKAEGLDMFKATETSLYIRSGKSWDCVDGCKITVS